MEKNNIRYNFEIYLIGYKNDLLFLSEPFCDTYLKFDESDDLYYVSFYSLTYIQQKITSDGNFWNPDIIIVDRIGKYVLYETINQITSNGLEKYHISDNFTNCGKITDVLEGIDKGKLLL